MNNNADPETGQAFVIVTTVEEEGKFPFHAAFVAATDGELRYTLEVFAPPPGEENSARNQKGYFNYYAGSNKAKLTAVETFHERWKKFFTEPVTMGLKPTELEPPAKRRKNDKELEKKKRSRR